MTELERISLTIEKSLLARFDKLLSQTKQTNRSEAIRDLIRNRLVEEEWSNETGETVATITLVYDHHQRELADRLVNAGHAHHGAVLATLHVHLDEKNCLEVTVLRGKASKLRHFAEHLFAMRGVKHGKLVMSSAAV